MRKLLLGALLAGCATSYRSSYTDHALGTMRHSIDVQVNGYTSSGTALDYAHRRADELCPSGYDVVDGTRGSRTSYIANGNTVTEINKPEVALVVQCREQATGVVDRQPTSPPAASSQTRNVVYGATPLWCSTGSASGNCEKTKELCEAMREQLGSGMAECITFQAAACFNYSDAVSGHRGVVCTPTVTDCEKQLAWDVERYAKDWVITATECGIYRVRDAGSGGE